ncbi:MAG: peptidoglycan DD-metalloendopeptidase family protein [Candidatus Zixiibacteriota bacterium]|nr:MAG: peptidoglycan DD-metalloendopeptidase family protein [candidate division Zixibacteria bacterium]
MRSRVLILSIVFSLLCLVGARADVKDDILIQQEEMERIKKEVKESREKLDSLKQTEVDIQKMISEGDQKLATDKKVIARLNRQLRGLQSDIAQTASELENRQLELDLSRRRYLGNIRQFYIATHKPPEIFSEDPNEELVLQRQIIYLTALASFESGNVDQAYQVVEQTMQTQDELTGKTKHISSLKRKRETASSLVVSAKRKHQKTLEQVRREKTEEADKILTLEQAAREMEAIIARLQQEMEDRRAREGVTEGPSVFATLKGQLLPPCRGEIVVPFGDAIDPVTKLKSFSSGISIKAGSGSKVAAVASGSVSYIGNLRGYGNFIIINHDDRYYTTYAGLSDIVVSVNEYVLAGNKLAVADAAGVVKFEIREGRNPLDPVTWISIDSF